MYNNNNNNNNNRLCKNPYFYLSASFSTAVYNNKNSSLKLLCLYSSYRFLTFDGYIYHYISFFIPSVLVCFDNIVLVMEPFMYSKFKLYLRVENWTYPILKRCPKVEWYIRGVSCTDTNICVCTCIVRTNGIHIHHSSRLNYFLYFMYFTLVIVIIIILYGYPLGTCIWKSVM
jgi:hypothetical protein